MRTTPAESDAAWGRSGLAIAAIVVVFAAAGAWPVPDVNETAYLTKARHSADPAWCRGDFFLETPDAHGVFYVLMGPLAAAVPLETAAWIGRWLGWLALAAGFWRAAQPLLAGTWGRLLAAALFALALRHTTAAGEWVIGGCESKVFAWAFVLAAVGEIAWGRFAAAWLACGAGAALHPIVGGWSLAALAASGAWSGAAERPTIRHRAEKPSAGRLLPGAWMIAGGCLLAAAGLGPVLGLQTGADAATRSLAGKVYVVERLSHHLLPRTFADGMVARHLLAVLAWWLLSRVRQADGEQGRRWSRCERFIWVSLLISAAGWLVSLFEPVAPDVTYALLRFYWFRLADVLVPLGLALAAAAVVCDDATLGRLTRMRPAVVRTVVGLLLALDLVHESRHWPLPGRDGPSCRADGKVDAVAWRETCDWVAAHAPPEAVFLTPRGAASFTWRTARREVVAWKNSPQDARSLVAWRERFIDCFSRDGGFARLERTTAALGAERLRAVAEKYGADHAIIPTDLPGAADLPFERLHANGSYAVYRLAPPRSPAGGTTEESP